jgi:ribonucrease Y
VLAKEEEIDRKLTDLADREVEVGARELAAQELSDRLKDLESRELLELERLSHLTVEEAKAQLLQRSEELIRHDLSREVRQLEEEARNEAKRRARNLVADALQRVAASHAAETTVSLVELPSDDMKGRIIGREGRNIRALESLTGVEVIIDDTPQAVLLSSFDPVRREVARITLSKLIEDGRIHPARIEETYYQSKAELEEHIVQAGEQAVFEAHCGEFHEELVKLLGRLRYRTSYGQNVLKHTLEVVHLTGIMAAELEASVKTAKRAALLHDVGKAVTHEVEGSHAGISSQYARRFGESQGVVHAIEAHHYEVQPQTVEAVLLIAADAISASRPGARGESLENYIKRLEALEEIAMNKDGVEKAYALQAGREIRVMVKPAEVDDDGAVLLSHEIAREIEDQLEYPGQVKVTVIRESRAIEVAK